jgi:hypothetical protein
MLAEIKATRHGRALRAVYDENFRAPEGEPERRLVEPLRRDNQGNVLVGHIAAPRRLSESGRRVKRAPGRDAGCPAREIASKLTRRTSARRTKKRAGRLVWGDILDGVNQSDPD